MFLALVWMASHGTPATGIPRSLTFASERPNYFTGEVPSPRFQDDLVQIAYRKEGEYK